MHDMATGSALLLALARRIRRLRSAHGWSRDELARRAELSSRFLARVESGDGNISVLRLEGLAHALGTTADQLVRPATIETPIIALTGLRGAGKSTVGPLLAQRLALPFVEIDERIREAAGLPPAQIFELHGERYYRTLEAEALATILSAGSPSVLATAGGVVNEAETWSRLCESTRVVWLKADAEEHWNRVVQQGDQRPMADNPQAMDQLRKMLADRESTYAQAWLTVVTTGQTPDQVAAAITRALEDARPSS